MQVYGNKEGLNNEIEHKYTIQVKEIFDAAESEVSEIIKEADERAEMIIEQAKTDAEIASREAMQRVLNEEKLNAKRKFEDAREKLILEVINKVKNKSKEISKSKEYLAFLKSNNPNEKSANVYGSETAYKKIFPKMKIDNSIIGVKIMAEDAVYDFTLENLINSNDEVVRRTITTEMFKE